MSVVWFALRNTHASFASVESALATASAAKYTSSWSQSSRVCSRDATITIIGANITDAERIGDLAPLASANEGVGVFLMEFVSQSDKDLRLFDLLAESGRTTIYLRPEFAQASVGAAPTSPTYDTGDGLTYGTAVAGPQNIAAEGSLTFAGNPSNNQTIVLNGSTWTFVTAGATGNQTNIQGSLAATLTQLASDLNASADTSIDDAYYTVSSTQLFVWHQTYGADGFAYTLAVGTAASARSGATLTTRDGNTNLPTLVNGSTTLYVCDDHLTFGKFTGGEQRIPALSGANDNSRVHVRYDYPGRPGKIWGGCILQGVFTDNGDGTFTDSDGLHNNSQTPFLRDCGFAGTENDGAELTKVSSATECANTLDSYFSASFANGGSIQIHLSDEGDPRYRVMQPNQGYSWWVNSQVRNYITVYDEQAVMPSDYLSGHWISPPPANFSFIAGNNGGWRRHFARNGVAAWQPHFNSGSWGIIDNILIEDGEIDRGNSGLYFVGQDASNKFQSVTVNRLSVSNVGGVIPEEADNDGHGFGSEFGIDSLTITNLTLDTCGGYFAHYVHTSDTATGMSVNTVTIQGGHPSNWPQIGSGTADIGFALACDNDSVSDKSGSSITGVTVKADAGVVHAIRNQWEDLATFTNPTVEQGAYSGGALAGARSFNDAGTVRGPSTKMRGHDFSAGSGASWSWVNVVSTAAFGTGTKVIDFDSGTYREGTAGDDDGTRFNVTGIGSDTFAQWQAESELNCTFDPASTLVAA